MFQSSVFTRGQLSGGVTLILVLGMLTIYLIRRFFFSSSGANTVPTVGGAGADNNNANATNNTNTTKKQNISLNGGSNSFTIYVQTAHTHKGPQLMTVNQTDTIGSIKQRFEGMVGISTFRQMRFVHNGIFLQDTDTVSQCNVHPGDRLYLM